MLPICCFFEIYFPEAITWNFSDADFYILKINYMLCVLKLI